MAFLLQAEADRLSILRERQRLLFPRGPRLTVLPVVELATRPPETIRLLRPDEEAALRGEIHGARWERPRKKKRKG